MFRKIWPADHTHQVYQKTYVCIPPCLLHDTKQGGRWPRMLSTTPLTGDSWTHTVENPWFPKNCVFSSLHPHLLKIKTELCLHRLHLLWDYHPCLFWRSALFSLPLASLLLSFSFLLCVAVTPLPNRTLFYYKRGVCSALFQRIIVVLPSVLDQLLSWVSFLLYVLFACSLACSLPCLLTHSLARSLVRSLSCLLAPLLARLLALSLACSLAPLLAPLFARSLARLLPCLLALLWGNLAVEVDQPPTFKPSVSDAGIIGMHHHPWLLCISSQST